MACVALCRLHLWWRSAFHQRLNNAYALLKMHPVFSLGMSNTPFYIVTWRADLFKQNSPFLSAAAFVFMRHYFMRKKSKSARNEEDVRTFETPIWKHFLVAEGARLTICRCYICITYLITENNQQKCSSGSGAT